MVKVLVFGLMGGLGGLVISGWVVVSMKAALAGLPLAF
jgi:hypothetical protein